SRARHHCHCPLGGAHYWKRGVRSRHCARLLGGIYVPGGRVSDLRCERSGCQQFCKLNVCRGLSPVWRANVQQTRLSLGDVAARFSDAHDGALP
ncbi:hypothetical protein KXX06_006324, partial [Aspergillus fumigatus]